jgi:hypothetical protein
MVICTWKKQLDQALKDSDIRTVWSTVRDQAGTDRLSRIVVEIRGHYEEEECYTSHKFDRRFFVADEFVTKPLSDHVMRVRGLIDGREYDGSIFSSWQDAQQSIVTDIRNSINKHLEEVSRLQLLLADKDVAYDYVI